MKRFNKKIKLFTNKVNNLLNSSDFIQNEYHSGRITPVLKRNISNGNAPTPIGTYLTGVFNTSNYTAVNTTISNPTASTLKVVQGTHTLNPCGVYNNTYLTGRDNNISTRRYVVNNLNSESWGIGASLFNYNGAGSDYISAIFGHAFNEGTFYICTGNFTVLTSGAGVLPATQVGDTIEINLTVNVNVYTATVKNITQNSATQTLTYTDTYTSGVLAVTRTLSYPATRLLGGDYTLSKIDESTAEYKFCDLLFVSNSKGVGAYCGVVSNKAIEAVKVANPTKRIVNNSGFNDTTNRFLLKNAELLAYKAKVVCLYDFTNDVRFGVGGNTSANLDTLISTHTANGSIVVIINSTCEGSGGVDATISNAIAVTKVIGSKYYDSYTPSQTAGVLQASYDSGDHVHPNGSFNTTVLQPLIQSIITTWT